MVYFIGAGPGDPELITVKAQKIIERADVIIYAGSLVNPEVLSGAKQGCRIYDSAVLNFEEVIALMQEAEKADLITARVHTGDPCLFGAVREQMDKLSSLGIEYSLVPGVSSFQAAAAALEREYTLPGVSQTVIITRIEGRTAVPERERIEELAAHHATMVLFLSADRIEEVVQRLLCGYESSTPAAVVYKASWKDEKIIRGRLSDISDKTKKAGITRTALICVGDFLGDEYELSKLYDKTFSHGYRKGEKQ